MTIKLFSLKNKIIFFSLTILLFNSFNSKVFSQNGTVKSYFPSGKVAARLSFIKDVLEGTSKWYYENGNLKEVKNYSNGKLNGISQNFYESGLLKDETRYVYGILDGAYKCFYDNGGLWETKFYDKGKLVSLTKIDYDSLYIAPLSAYSAGRTKRSSAESDFICPLEICPEPVGGIKEIQKNIVYPELAKKYNLEGFVMVSVNVDTKGKVKNVKVIKGLGLGCDEAAIDAIKKTKFIPGEEKGELKETEVTFRLNFDLDKQKEEKKTKIVYAESNLKSFVIDSTKSFITCDLEECPEPVGGIMTLVKNVRYPPQAKRNGIKGDVIVEAKVNDLGFVISVKVIKDLGFGTEQAAKTAVLKTQFEPGKKNGKFISSIIKISVPFMLEE